MKRMWNVGIALLVAAGCGPAPGGQGVKSADEWIAEQEKIAAEQEKHKKDTGDYGDLETDEEKKAKFDKKQTKMELQRATRSAESCPGVVADQETPQNKHRGEATVTITFQEDGSVKDVSIPAPFAETPVGECVQNAFTPIKVPPYAGGDQTVEWTVTLEDAKKGAKKK